MWNEINIKVDKNDRYKSQALIKKIDLVAHFLLFKLTLTFVHVYLNSYNWNDDLQLNINEGLTFPWKMRLTFMKVNLKFDGKSDEINSASNLTFSFSHNEHSTWFPEHWIN